ncbi:ferric reduction oxidase 2-like [Magnolia sinica]|uniref:ferric reduction oxidase 2-like n=1 Tax=Magnolia sinica TaxID=86752 RepID=UPI0026597D09|nr:ferric reduction oxidase 2-like [Magnolia sinica]
MDPGVKEISHFKGTARVAMEILLGLVFLGWLMIWVLMPTNTYWMVWFPKLRSQMDSTYFGTQGANLLIFTFPILFIAVMGCVCLHLGNKSGNYVQRINHPHLASWRRPVLVKGPLGIVSWIELAFFTMFMALLIWSFFTLLRIGFSNIDQHSAEEDGQQVWEAKLETAALRLGLIGNICCAFLFFPVTRGSSILPLVGLTSEGSIKYHIWLGHMSMTLFTAHGLCYIVYWAVTNQISEMLKWEKFGIAIIPGELALLSGLIMWATSFSRHKMFELFYYTHHLYFLFLIFFVLHVGFSFFCIILPSIYLFLIDRYLRFLISRRNVHLVSARVLPCEVAELIFSKSPDLSYTPTSIVLINVPRISTLQWHPFTVSSSSNMEEDKLSIIIKSDGSWTRKLYQTLLSADPMDRLDVSIEGPYGPTSTHFLRHDKLVMISGGSGLTPFISIIKEFIFKATIAGHQAPRIHLICAFKNSLDLTMLDLLLPPTTTASSDISHIDLQLDVFITREKDPTSNNPKHVRTIWFKPSPIDVPIYAVLGPNSWLWLGAIITTSFIIFLLLLGFLTRYYIYPIDRNTNEMYPHLAKSAFSVLFMCLGIVVAAGSAVLWNKKQNAMEGKQIENTEAVTPTTSPGSWFYNEDRELESLNHQSLVQATKVHFGARPHLRKMLLECKEGSVGVLVCGPSEMRHEVAAICSSGLMANLHFESISFSW